jgi:hypothetical protein
MDFSPGYFRNTETVFVKRPNDRDVSLRYHILEMKNVTWLVIAVVYFGLWIVLSIILFLLLSCNVEQNKNILETSKLYTSMSTSLVIALKAYIRKVSPQK